MSLDLRCGSFTESPIQSLSCVKNVKKSVFLEKSERWLAQYPAFIGLVQNVNPNKPLMDKLVLSIEMSKTGASPALTEQNFIKSEAIRNKKTCKCGFTNTGT